MIRRTVFLTEWLKKQASSSKRSHGESGAKKILLEEGALFQCLPNLFPRAPQNAGSEFAVREKGIGTNQ